MITIVCTFPIFQYYYFLSFQYYYYFNNYFVCNLGSEIAEYLQENLHHELQHFLESEEDVEMALYLGFLAADTTLKVPEIIAEINSKLDFENRGNKFPYLFPLISIFV